MYVPPEQMNIQGVEFERGLCFKVSGKWDDLHKLAIQVKSRWVASTYTVLLVSGKPRSDEPSELIIAGHTPHVEDNAYRLVEQRIQEGLNVEIVHGQYYRDAFIYSFDENKKQETEDESLGILEDHPF